MLSTVDEICIVILLQRDLHDNTEPFQCDLHDE